MDDCDHGTHVAGTIGAVGNNGIGTSGVNWQVSLLAVKFLDKDGNGTNAAAVDSIRYAIKMHANVISNSWGGTGNSRAIRDAIEDARDAGILFVAAAGNEGMNNDDTPAYPASYDLDNIISVAATDHRDLLPWWSNVGPSTVHLAAPGIEIFSTLPKKKYGYMSGTSMATPHVSGAAALLWAANRKLDYLDVKS